MPSDGPRRADNAGPDKHRVPIDHVVHREPGHEHDNEVRHAGHPERDADPLGDLLSDSAAPDGLRRCHKASIGCTR